MDQVVAIVHDRILTDSDAAIMFSEWRQANPELAQKLAGDREALKEQLDRLLVERIEELLQIQACRDAGFDPVRIEELVDHFFDEYVQRHGGPAQTAEYLASHSRTPAELKENMRDRMLASTWREMETGKNPGITGRVERDRFVRPGQIWAVYEIEETQKDAHWMDLIGGEPERVVLQSLALPVDTRGTEAALEQAADIRTEAVEGADFSQLVRTWSANPRENGMSKPLPVQTLAAISRTRHGDERFAEFVRGAGVGTISEPMLGHGSRGGTASQDEPEDSMVFLYRMVERLPARMPAFDDVATQGRIRKEIERLTDERRLNTAMRLLKEAAAPEAPPVKK